MNAKINVSKSKSNKDKYLVENIVKNSICNW